jgi:hypothetical protein
MKFHFPRFIDFFHSVSCLARSFLWLPTPWSTSSSSLLSFFLAISVECGTSHHGAHKMNDNMQLNLHNFPFSQLRSPAGGEGDLRESEANRTNFPPRAHRKRRRRMKKFSLYCSFQVCCSPFRLIIIQNNLISLFCFSSQ